MTKSFSELPGCSESQILTLCVVVSHHEIENEHIPELQVECNSYGRNGECFKETLVLFPWQSDLGNGVPQEIEIPHKFWA